MKYYILKVKNGFQTGTEKISTGLINAYTKDVFNYFKFLDQIDIYIIFTHFMWNKPFFIKYPL